MVPDTVRTLPATTIETAWIAVGSCACNPLKHVDEPCRQPWHRPSLQPKVRTGHKISFLVDEPFDDEANWAWIHAFVHWPPYRACNNCSAAAALHLTCLLTAWLHLDDMLLATIAVILDARCTLM
jgi:hypothetical protein